MAKDATAAKLPQDIASAVNLMAHPAAGAVALSALSIGVASQMFGVWVGLMTGAAATAERLVASLDDLPPEEGAEPAAKAPADKARSATVTLLADVRKAAEKAAKRASAKPVVERTVEPAAKPAPTTTGPAKPATIDRPATPDDLKLIAGIGPKLEKVLNGLGLWTFAQIAAWTPDETAWVDNFLSFSGRIERDGWVAQATKLQAKG